MKPILRCRVGVARAFTAPASVMPRRRRPATLKVVPQRTGGRARHHRHVIAASVRGRPELGVSGHAIPRVAVMAARASPPPTRQSEPRPASVRRSRAAGHRSNPSCSGDLAVSRGALGGAVALLPPSREKSTGRHRARMGGPRPASGRLTSMSEQAARSRGAAARRFPVAPSSCGHDRARSTNPSSRSSRSPC